MYTSAANGKFLQEQINARRTQTDKGCIRVVYIISSRDKTFINQRIGILKCILAATGRVYDIIKLGAQ